MKKQVATMMYTIWHATNGEGAIHKERKQWSGSKESATLHYSASFVNEKGDQKVMMFSDPEIMKLLKQ